ncbi:multidrug effflux MFS transporter [Salinarimonas ramus]|uniref:Bcr/CflA family efflux transporter n=1 Tax=Salinarimonas ramus TaxID=690164 RepID=A0A917V5G5_9HYPH|nr:multidrug effflux MFS transporter [Salinarimonas ramus]GGK42576.1 Bcr/CflA family drug resistance efflux transporter [Salinarimonas ramus]
MRPAPTPDPAPSRFTLLRADTLGMTATLAMLTSLGPLSTDMYLPALPAIAQALEATTSQTQATLSAFLVGFACGQFLYGPLSDRLGRKPLLHAGLALFLLATLACALAPTIEALSAARFAQALGASGPIVLARAIVRDLYDGPRAGRELSRMGSIMGLVPAVAPILGGLVFAALGWRAIFGASLLGAVALTAIVVLLLPETLTRRDPTPLSLLSILRGFRDLLRHRSYRVYVALNTLTYSGLFAFISGSSFVLQGEYALSELVFAFSFALMVVGYIAGTILAQKVVPGRGLDGTIVLGVAAQAAGGVLMLALVLLGTRSSLEVTLPMALYAVGVGLTMPQSMAAAMQPFPERAGAASSLMGICQMSVAAIVGIGLGAALAATPLALPGTIAALGAGALAVFAASRGARAQ